MRALSILPLALQLLLSAALVRAGFQCALVPPKDYTKQSGGGGGGGGGGGSGPVGNATAPAPGPCVREKLSAAWYTGWHAAQVPPAAVSWARYSLVTYSFATTSGGADPLSLGDGDRALLTEFVDAAHAHNVKASLSLGGWSGSEYFSGAVADAANRTTLVNAILALVYTFDLDGIDFDWEFPAESGAGNEYSARDSTNFLLLLEAIRATKIGKELVLSAAVSTEPFTGPDGAPLADVSMFAMVLDFVEIMVYDIFGTDDPRGVGPNAPLNDTCAASPAGSAVSAVKAWTGAHFPAYQLSLGVASYGHQYNISRSSSSAFTQAGVSAATCSGFGARVQSNFTWDGTEGADACGNPLPSGGIWDFNSLVSGGYLDKSGKPADGIEYRFDSCSRTPYVYSSATEIMISYDDAASFAAKGNFIRDNGLLGFSMWELAADYDDILVGTISDAMRCLD